MVDTEYAYAIGDRVKLVPNPGHENGDLYGIPQSYLDQIGTVVQLPHAPFGRDYRVEFPSALSGASTFYTTPEFMAPAKSPEPPIENSRRWVSEAPTESPRRWSRGDRVKLIPAERGYGATALVGHRGSVTDVDTYPQSNPEVRVHFDTGYIEWIPSNALAEWDGPIPRTFTHDEIVILVNAPDDFAMNEFIGMPARIEYPQAYNPDGYRITFAHNPATGYRTLQFNVDADWLTPIGEGKPTHANVPSRLDCPACREAELAAHAEAERAEAARAEYQRIQAERHRRQEERKQNALKGIKISALRTRYPDPTRRWAITKRVMVLWLLVTGEKDSYSRQRYAAWLEELPPVATDADYEERLGTIVERAERDWHERGGDNCTSGTDHFLEDFGLGSTEDFEEEEEPEPESTRKLVTVTATITFYVENDVDTGGTESDVTHYLRIETAGNVDDMDHESIDFTINSVDVEIDE